MSIRTNRHVGTTPRELQVPDDGRRPKTALKVAYFLSGVIAVGMFLASAAGLFLRDLYPDGPWARQAFRGGDLVTLVVASPVLIVSLLLSMRGSRRAQPVWIGMLGYALYNYAYYVFGAEFNDLFLLHIALLSMSAFAIACALPNLDAEGIAAELRGAPARLVGAFLVAVGLIQGGLWIFVVLRFAAIGTLLRDVPVDGQHLVFALDLSLLVPSLAIAGILLFRRTAAGYLLGPAMASMGAGYLLNLMVAGVFQANANVVGAKAFPPESLVLTTGMLVASALLLWPRRRSEKEGTEHA